MGTDYKHYFRLASALMTLFASAIACTVYGQSFGMHMLGAALLGAFWQQVCHITKTLNPKCIPYTLHVYSKP